MALAQLVVIHDHDHGLPAQRAGDDPDDLLDDRVKGLVDLQDFTGAQHLGHEIRALAFDLVQGRVLQGDAHQPGQQRGQHLAAPAEGQGIAVEHRHHAQQIALARPERDRDHAGQIAQAAGHPAILGEKLLDPVTDRLGMG